MNSRSGIHGAVADADGPAEGTEVRGERAALPSASAIDSLAEVFAVLGDPGRLRLLSTLLAAGELCVGDLAAAAEMSQSAASHALRLLRAHRIVTVSRRGRLAYYRLEDAHVRMLLDLGFVHGDHTTTLRDVSAPTLGLHA